MKGNVVNVRRVAGEPRDELAVGRVPKLDQIVVAASGDAGSVGANGERSQPALMCFHDANGHWFLVRGWPPDEAAVVAATIQHISIGRRTQGADPAIVGGQLRDGFCLEVETMN